LTVNQRAKFKSPAVRRAFCSAWVDRRTPMKPLHPLSCPRKNAKRVFARDVAVIHVLLWPAIKDVDGQGHRRAEATPFFDRLCPAHDALLRRQVVDLLFYATFRVCRS
jgi:hypothetical protein